MQLKPTKEDLFHSINFKLTFDLKFNFKFQASCLKRALNVKTLKANDEEELSANQIYSYEKLIPVNEFT